MGKQFSRTPVTVPRVKTRHRTIRTRIPVPRSLPILARLEKNEPMSMQGQPPIVWHRAEGCNVYDRWGNRWIDWSCGVLITNVGHGHPAICKAVREVVDRPLLATYCFPNEERAALARKLVAVAPKGLDKAFILTTGAEGLECAIKLARTRGLKIGKSKTVIVSFLGDFHGRTLAAQLAGGIPALKDWCGDLAGRHFVQVPWPGDFRVKDKRFNVFRATLKAKGVKASDVCAVIAETYQGGMASFAPKKYMQDLAAWTKKHNALLVYDEVQAGFGRTGTFWGFEHYGTRADLICCGKGISSSLPIAAVLGPSSIMNQYPPGTMTSTHAAAPLGCAAALANINVILKEKLVARSAAGGKILRAGLELLKAAYPANIAAVNCTGMVAAVCMVKPGTEEADADAAHAIVEKCFQKGLLMFAPVGPGGMSVKIAPPLTMPVPMMKEALGVLAEAFAEVLG
ncbi:MAG: aspartate aminotransferase family protein [Planctomycetota bacterium]